MPRIAGATSFCRLFFQRRPLRLDCCYRKRKRTTRQTGKDLQREISEHWTVEEAKQVPIYSGPQIMNTLPRHDGSQLLLPAVLSFALLVGPVSADTPVESYLDLDLEDLLSLEVTSVSKKKQRLSEAAAAVFVITQEDIRRSGVTSIPEALRLAPGLDVAKLDSNKWAISSRGFNSQFANKLLVLIDGRSVYTPTYSGVYWDIQDTVLEDIDRIEVIRGPGAALWGANAVNGVINIITKKASETQGGLLVAGAGNEEKGFASLRYGKELGDQTYGRAYVKYNDRGSSYAPLLHDDAGDDWQALRAGFRLDGALSESSQWTFQGDIYETDENQLVRGLILDPTDLANIPLDPVSLIPLNHVPDNFDASGWNLLGRWEHRISERSATTLQVYYDHTERDEIALGQTHDTLDIDFQHELSPFEPHDIVWGLGYRRISDDFDNTFAVSLIPSSRTIHLYSAFIQDEIELMPDTLRFTLGSKFEHNDYTGFEVQPNARLLWLPREGHTLWTAVSRAVRTPSRIEENAVILAGIIPPPPEAPPGTPPVVLTVNGNEDFDSEDLLAIELGYRLQAAENLSLDLALFHNRYRKLQTLGFTSSIPPSFIFDNRGEAVSRGLELVMDWRPKEWWRLQANYSYIDISTSVENASDEAPSTSVLDFTPKHQASVRSAMDLSNDWSLDLWAYHVAKLDAGGFGATSSVPAYTSLNARLAWRPRKEVELSLVGQNLLDKRHPEFIGESFVTETEVERSIYGQVRWDF